MECLRARALALRFAYSDTRREESVSRSRSFTSVHSSFFRLSDAFVARAHRVDAEGVLPSIEGLNAHFKPSLRCCWPMFTIKGSPSQSSRMQLARARPDP